MIDAVIASPVFAVSLIVLATGLLFFAGR